MKKKFYIFAIIVAVVGIFLFLSQKSFLRYHALMQQEDPLFSDMGVYVFQIEDKYPVLLEKNGRVFAAVEFSAERVAVKIRGVQLPQIDDILGAQGKTIEEIENTFGKPHINTGSGFYIPSYITSDGYLIKIWVSNGIVTNVTRIDLLTGEVVEWY